MPDGAYMRNFAGCANCGRRDMLSITTKKDIVHAPKSGRTRTATVAKPADTSSDEEESVVFNHVCSACGHVICQHSYLFEADDTEQRYEMDCMLCGVGEDSRKWSNFDPTPDTLAAPASQSSGLQVSIAEQHLQQSELLPSVMAEIKRTRCLAGRLVKCAFPVVDSDADGLVSDAPALWRKFLELVCSVAEDKMANRTLLAPEYERVKAFVQCWSTQRRGPAWLHTVANRLKLALKLAPSATSKIVTTPPPAPSAVAVDWGSKQSAANGLGLSATEMASALVNDSKDSESDWSEEGEENM